MADTNCCPVCGSPNLKIEKEWPGNWPFWRYYVDCGTCYWRSASRVGKKRAIKDWNTSGNANKQFTRKELHRILTNHMHWLCKDVEGWQFLCADFSDADLSGINLEGAYLAGAIFTRANLRRANLRDAILCGADLSGADLRFAFIQRADLRKSDLEKTDFRFADLEFANLSGAFLIDTRFFGSNLYGVDCVGAIVGAKSPRLNTKKGR